MLAEPPVIVAASGGNLEAIRHGETGIFVPPDDVEGFADNVERLSREPDCARAIAAPSQADALDRLGIGRHAEAILGILDRLLQRTAV